MPHAVTQSCVGDGSCVYACPVNCIQPTPDDPAFDLAEMLFIDPVACVDCGACVSACPVDAIKPHHELEAGERAFLELNAVYHHVPRARPTLAPIRPRLRVRDFGVPLDVAIVGSGPAAMYAAEELLTIPGARVTIYERLDRPYGLVRSGVAPDHRRTRRVAGQLDRIRRHPRLAMRLGVEIGTDLTHDELLARHHAVIYAVGASTDRRLEIPGADLPGVASATSFVGWYNGHPDFADLSFDLSQPRVAVVGNGNVALDVARMLTVDPATLVGSEIAPHALEALRRSAVEEVVIVGRRGAEHSAFTLPELIGLSTTPGIELVVDPSELPADPGEDPKLALLRGLATPAATAVAAAESSAAGSSAGVVGRTAARTIRLRYGLTPQRILGTDRVTGLELAPTGVDGALAAAHGSTTTIDAGLVLTAIGYRGLPVPSLPYDGATGTVPNDGGRVIADGGESMPGTYVTGWIKRGPTGFIGTNKRCAQDTVAELVDDHNAGRLRTAGSAAPIADRA